MSKSYAAALLGGSGSVGKFVLKSLLADENCTSVVLVSRRSLDDLKAMDPERVQVQVVDPFDDKNISKLEGLKNVQMAFCTLGVGSSRKVSKDELMRIDVDIPAAFAAKCKDAGVTHYCLLSAVGADESSTWNNLTRTAAGGGWYNHVKGVVERKTIECKFPYTFIAQPGALLGSPHTPGIMDYVPTFLIPIKYSSAHVSDIAAGMVQATTRAFQNNTSGVIRVTGGIPISKAGEV